MAEKAVTSSLRSRLDTTEKMNSRDFFPDALYIQKSRDPVGVSITIAFRVNLAEVAMSLLPVNESNATIDWLVSLEKPNKRLRKYRT